MTRPKLLDDAEVQRRLADLRHWSGDAQQIRRTVMLASDRLPALLDEVDRVQEELDHHAQVERQPGGVTFVVWTHSAGGVTELDLQLAGRIDTAVERAGSFG